MSPVLHALRVNDVSERRPFLQSSGARFIAATISLLARISSSRSTCRGVVRFAETTSRFDALPLGARTLFC